VENETKPVLQINQNFILVLAIGASVLAIVLYYENKKLRDQFMPKRQPCNCQEQEYLQTTPATRMSVDMDGNVTFTNPVEHSSDPRVMPNNQKPPEVVVD